MKVTLITYDSTLLHNAGYLNTAKAVEFGDNLKKIAAEFAAIAEVSEEDIYWVEVYNSDWCKNMSIFYTRVAADWQPTDKTNVVGAIKDESYPNLDFNFDSYIKGRGNVINNKTYPPINAHSLYRSKKA